MENAVCPHCGGQKSVVIKTWRGGELIRRRRRCEDCGKSFSTAQNREYLCDKAPYAVAGVNLHCHLKKG
jgi:transcriptional regulator NrdR family protein